MFFIILFNFYFVSNILYLNYIIFIEMRKIINIKLIIKKNSDKKNKKIKN